MSRAFVKEQDADYVEDLPERPISPHRNDVTERGLAMINDAVDHARHSLSEAQESGDRDAAARAGRDLRYWTARQATASADAETVLGAISRLAEMIEARSSEFADLCSGPKEVERSIDRFVWYAGWADKLAQVIGFVLSADGFGDQPKVINGASDLFEEVLGEAGRHTRAALGTNALPFSVTVEIAAVAVVRTS